MPIFLDTSDKPVLAIGICARCCFKMPLVDLYPDPNSPGLMVCKKDLDQYDPYRLPPPPADRIGLQFARPDAPLIPATVSAQSGGSYLATGSGSAIVTGSGGEIEV